MLLVGAAVVGWLAGGGPGATGAAIGVGVVSVSYTLSTLAIAGADSISPQLVLPVGLTMYATKFTILGLLMAAVVASGWAGLVPLGVGVAVGVVGWTAAQIWWIVTVHAPHQVEKAAS